VPRVSASPAALRGDGTGKVLALRREDNSVWERRCPLSPSQVQELVKCGVKVIVQPSNRRAFAMQVTITCCLSEALDRADLRMCEALSDE